MRRPLGWLLATLLVATGLAAGTALPGRAEEGDGAVRSEVVHAAQRALHGAGPDGAATLALADLFEVRDRLTGADRAAADRILARPTDGFTDQYGDGYTVPATQLCSADLCLHYVTSTADATPGLDADGDGVPDLVRQTLAVLEHVWDRELDQLGYRRPPSDGTRGGDDRFDVYLADVGSAGLYGYCAPEQRVAGAVGVATSYCVLDNDMAEFPIEPLLSMEVTAAHEFFHAVQFGYDVGEDRWFMESTATWMEEQVYDEVNDNRQYLPSGQLVRPQVPLDLFEWQGLGQYANWVFFERLAARYGVDAVRRVWYLASARPHRRNLYATKALDRYLRGRASSLPRFYAQFAAGNTLPGRFYAEGSGYPRAPLADRVVFREPRRVNLVIGGVQQLASSSVGLVPRLPGRHQVTVRLDGPRRATGVAARVLVLRTDGRVRSREVALDRTGRGSVRLPFSRRDVRRVVLTLANGSSDFICRQGTDRSCHGEPRHPRSDFLVRVAVPPATAPPFRPTTARPLEKR